MSIRIGFVLIALLSTFVWNESQIGNYPELNPTDCGLNRQLLDNEPNTCFEWHNSATMGQIKNGKNLSYGEAPWLVYVDVDCPSWLGSPCDRPNEDKITVISGYQFVYNQWKEHQNDSQWLTDHDLVVRDVANFTVHHKYPNYDIYIKNLTADIDINFAFPTHDLALIQLSAPIQSSPVLRNSICVPTKHYTETADSYVMFAGYGHIVHYSPFDTHFKDLPAQVTYAVSKPTNVSRLMLITAPEGAGDYCFNDYGGPVWQFVGGKAVLIGVHSMFEEEPNPLRDCSKKGINIETRVSYYIDWIIEVTGLDRSHLEVTGH